MVTMKVLVLPAFWTVHVRHVSMLCGFVRPQWIELTKIGRIGVEDGQAHKLLSNLGPAGNEEAQQIATLEDGPLAKFVVDLGQLTLSGNGGTHDFL